MPGIKIVRFAYKGLIVGGFALIAGCSGVGNSSNSNETIRVETATAPTDLQLICAAKTAEKFKADENTTLPIGSSDIGEGKFTVKVKMGDKQADCVIDNDAKIISITEA